jgi:hypothetical protein
MSYARKCACECECARANVCQGLQTDLAVGENGAVKPADDIRDGLFRRILVDFLLRDAPVRPTQRVRPLTADRNCLAAVRSGRGAGPRVRVQGECGCQNRRVCAAKGGRSGGRSVGRENGVELVLLWTTSLLRVDAHSLAVKFVEERHVRTTRATNDTARPPLLICARARTVSA